MFKSKLLALASVAAIASGSLSAVHVGDVPFEVSAQIVSLHQMTISNNLGVVIDPAVDDLTQAIVTNEAQVRSFSNNPNGQFVRIEAYDGYFSGADFLLVEQTGDQSHNMKFVIESDMGVDGSDLAGSWVSIGNNGDLIRTTIGADFNQQRTIRASILANEAYEKPTGNYLAKLALHQEAIE